MRHPKGEDELTAFDSIHLYPLDVTDPEQMRATSARILRLIHSLNEPGHGWRLRLSPSHL